MSKKKKLIPVILILVVAVIVAIVLVFTRGKKEVKVDGVVYVESVEDITGQGYLGTDRYLGVVEAQETKGVDAADDRKIKEIFVSEGDVVKEGDPLFEYDTDEMNLKLKQLELELSNINNSINTMNLQIKELEEERSRVPADEQYEYTSQIQNYQAQINQLNFDVGNKQLEIDNQSKELENTTVYAPMDGVIKKINSESSNSSGPGMYDSYDEYGSMGGESEHFINIMAMGDYRVKAMANELNVRNMTQGDAMLIRSRIDESITWQGVISTIDLEHPDNGNNDYYYGGGGTTVTKYPFYVSVTSENDLMLGQHVYVEADNGQETVKTGIWLDSDYIMQDETGAYISKDNAPLYMVGGHAGGLKWYSKKNYTVEEGDPLLPNYEFLDVNSLDGENGSDQKDFQYHYQWH